MLENKKNAKLDEEPDEVRFHEDVIRFNEIEGQRIIEIYTVGNSITIYTKEMNLTIKVDADEDNPDVFMRLDFDPEELVGSTILSIKEIYKYYDRDYRTHKIKTDKGILFINTTEQSEMIIYTDKD